MPRFMMLIKGDQPPGEMPNEEMLAAMVEYNEELGKAGALVDLAGLHPSFEAARVRFSGGERTVIEGPFPESKQLVAGYWIIDVPSMAEAVEWAKRVPFEIGGAHGYDRADGPEGEVEIRRVFELDEFAEGPAVNRARELSGDLEQQQKE
jgi:hypothetical protein